MPEMIAPPSSPMRTSEALSVHDRLAAEGRPEPDDIPESTVPPDAVDVFMATAIASSVVQETPEETITHRQGTEPWQDTSRIVQEPSSPSPVSPTGQTPHEVLLPLVEGFLGHIQRKIDMQMLETHKDTARSIEDLCVYMKGWTEGVLNKLVADAAHTAPYTASIQAVTPGGFPVTFTLAKPTQDALGAELMQLCSHLAAYGFTGTGVPV